MRDRNAERNITDQTVQMPSQNELRERNADMSGIERGSSAVFSTTSSSNTSQTPASIVTSGLVGDRRISLGAGAGCAGLVAQLEQGYHQAREAVRANNGIKVLLQLLQPRVVTPPGALDCLRALACRVLLGLSRNDTIAHKLTRLQVCNSEHCSCTTNSCFKSFWNSTAVPQMSIGRAGTSPSIQYGISNLPVFDKPAPVRISSLLTPRHLSQRRIRFPARKYHPKKEGPKLMIVLVPFFCNDEETPSTPKADALFIPRENPRALAIRPMEQWPGRANREERTPSKDMSRALENEEDIVESGLIKELGNPVKLCQKSNGVCDDHLIQKGDSYITLTGQRAGEAAIVYEYGADIEALMPKLRHSDYYTEPRIQELAAKERAEPGFCHHVKDFVVGCHGYGSIKFLGETDVRRLDLESLIQFNHREVIVYMDESKKPPVGQGLNKPAVVTLLNIKCFDKKTGSHYTEGPKIDKYKDMLGKKAEDQGADFVSYYPIKGEWKFKVNHFSEYGLGDEDD